MAEKPILMSAQMVLAYLEGSKTETRRIIKPQPDLPDGWHTNSSVSDIEDYCPYGKRGDSLWWRETWHTHAAFDHMAPREITARSVHYAADGPIKTGKKRPSIFMPRWACRIVTPITGVKCQQLHAMTAADAQHEGCGFGSSGYAKYIDLWNSLNEQRGFGWDTNPFVWVLEFDRYDG